MDGNTFRIPVFRHWHLRANDSEPMGEQTLPYRTTGDDIERLASALARGRDLEQVQSLFSSSNNFRGTVSAAEQFGLLNPDTEELTPSGKALALGDPEKRKEVLFSAVLDYGPYELLLEAISGEGIFGEDGDEFTPVEWIEKWWHTNGYGSSQTNRSEGSSSFAKIVEYLDIGEYKQGRRGHPSRIEWTSDAQLKIRKARNEEGREDLEASSSASDIHEVGSRAPTEKNSESASYSENNILTLNLGDDRVAKLSLPPKLTPREKKRLVDLVDLMIATEDQEEVQMQLDF
jgi:hypothetical protein